MRWLGLVLALAVGCADEDGPEDASTSSDGPGSTGASTAPSASSTSVGGAGDGGGGASRGAGGGDGGWAAGGGGSEGGGGEEPDCERWYEAGHGDVFISFDEESEALTVSLRSALEGSAEELLYAPEEVCIRVPFERYVLIEKAGGRPAGASWDPVGVAAGEAFWQLPSTATPETPWLGIAAEGVAQGALDDDVVSLRLLELEGPGDGQFSSYFVSSFGAPTFIFSTSASIDESSRDANSHAHMSWTFSHGGLWRVTFDASAIVGGVAITSPPATFLFVVETQP